MNRFLLICTLTAMSVFGAANRYMFVDGKGVLRYRDDAQEEVALFGVNYYPPFAIDYAALKQRGIDHKEAIRQDLAHFQRLGLTALRLHCSNANSRIKTEISSTTSMWSFWTI